MFPASIFHVGGTQGPAGATGATGAAGPTGPGPLGSMLAADAASVVSTMAALGLSVPVVSGTRYAFEAALFINAGDVGLGEGSLFDFDASTAAFTNLRAYGPDLASTTPFTSGAFVTSKSSDIPGPAGGDGLLLLTGSIEPSSNGTFAMRFSQVAHALETLTVYRGSWLLAWPI